MDRKRRAQPVEPDWPPSGRPDQRPIDPIISHLTHYLDQAFRIPGTDMRFGLDPILGLLLPGGGDALSSLLSAYLIWRSVRYGISKVVIGRMVFNVAVDYVLGSVPLIGDLFDFGFKANQKNLELLQRHASGGRGASWSDYVWLILLLVILAGLFVAGILAIIGLLHWSGLRLI